MSRMLFVELTAGISYSD